SALCSHPPRFPARPFCLSHCAANSPTPNYLDCHLYPRPLAKHPATPSAQILPARNLRHHRLPSCVRWHTAPLLTPGTASLLRAAVVDAKALATDRLWFSVPRAAGRSYVALPLC